MTESLKTPRVKVLLIFITNYQQDIYLYFTTWYQFDKTVGFIMGNIPPFYKNRKNTPKKQLKYLQMAGGTLEDKN